MKLIFVSVKSFIFPVRFEHFSNLIHGVVFFLVLFRDYDGGDAADTEWEAFEDAQFLDYLHIKVGETSDFIAAAFPSTTVTCFGRGVVCGL